MLDYRIYTFITLYNEMNYRKTAEKLNMTQPGVTQHIHYLEKHYGVKLFEYDGRTLSRTQNAIMLKKHIDCIIAEEKEISMQFLLSNPEIRILEKIPQLRFLAIKPSNVGFLLS